MAISWAFPPAHAAEIKVAHVKKQNTDRQDAQQLLKLMRENRFPRIWVPSLENRSRHPTSHERLTGLPWDASYHDGPAPVCQPQPAIVRLASSNQRLPGSREPTLLCNQVDFTEVLRTMPWSAKDCVLFSRL